MSPTVPDLPHLEEAALAVFDRYVAGAEFYLEYGCGGSTVHATRIGAKKVVSVDSSLEWISAVKAKIHGQCDVTLVHCEIGAVEEWGRPKDKRSIATYHTYMSTPWDIALNYESGPTVILIDGRFRVSCFLYSLLCSKLGTVILFDDYAERKNYHVVEKFCAVREYHGRLAVFEVTKEFSLPLITSTISMYSIVPD